MTHRTFTKDFKLQLIRKIEAGKTPNQAALGFQLNPKTIINCCKLHYQYTQKAYARNGKAYTTSFLPTSLLTKSYKVYSS